MLEFHTSQFVINSLDDDLSSLIKFLSASFFTSLAAFFNQLHQLLFFKFSREFAFCIDLIVLFFTMRFLISLKNIFNNLVPSATSALIPSDCGGLELLLLFCIISLDSRVIIVTTCCIRGCRLVLL
jgi:hypothetical protein